MEKRILNKILLVLFAMGICCLVSAQDAMSELSIDELLAIDVQSEVLPIEYQADELSDDFIRLGIMLPKSKFSEFSLEMERAARLAMDEINAQTDILGKKLALVVVDDAADNDICLTQFDSLTNELKTNFIIGPTNSSRLIAVANSLAPKEEVVLISPSASSLSIANLTRRGQGFSNGHLRSIPSQNSSKICGGGVEQKTCSGALH